eukprot:TRINITY_DN10504_c0_g1_i2.p1 TRINITY_DN10504_c0_g1~~TRINITY_DN10504_c0_g1_i2.p1  ORF type:complete len:350 (+),score=57.54 TRINITY_DN10504_c0_g1_i2:48-1052(+)
MRFQLIRRGLLATGGVVAGISMRTAYCEHGVHQVQDVFIPPDVVASGKLEDADAIYRPPFPINPENSQIFFDIGSNGRYIGRVEIELFDDCAPELALNLKALSTGSFLGYPIRFKHPTHHRGAGDEKLMSYTNTLFHKVVQGMYIQGGDNVYYNGRGGESFSGELLRDTFFDKAGKIPGPGCLCMVGASRHGISSQFMITYRAFPHLERRNSCVGQVLKGWGVLEAIERDATSSGVPRTEISIIQCGILKHKSGSLFEANDPVAVPKQFEWKGVGSVNMNTVTKELNMMDNFIIKNNSDYSLSSFDTRGGDGTGAKVVLPTRDLAADLTSPGGF